MFKSKKNICLFLFIFLFLTKLSFLNSMSRRFDRYDRALERRDRLEMQRERWAERQQLREELLTVKEKLEDLKEREKELTNKGLEREKGARGLTFKELDKQIATTREHFNFLNSEFGFLGDVILRGIAGKEGWEMIEDLKVGDDIWKGFCNGMMLKGSISVGDSIGNSIDRYIREVFGGTLGKLEEFITLIYRGIFHSSSDPFNEEEVTCWQRLVGNDLKELENMMKNVEKYDSRGRAEIIRECDSEEDDKDKTKGECTERNINLWQDFIEDIAATYQEIAQEIELRKEYYDKKENGFGVINCADRLKNKLLKTREWLLSVKSLKEFTNLAEAKSIIPSVKRSFDNYFDNLKSQVKPLFTKKSDVKGSSSNSFGRKDRWNGGDDLDSDYSSYPSYMR